MVVEGLKNAQVAASAFFFLSRLARSKENSFRCSLESTSKVTIKIGLSIRTILRQS